MQGGTPTQYLYDRANAVQETQGSTINPILVGLNIDERFARNDVDGRAYFLTDGLGSTLALTSTTGAIQNQYSYDPYGNASQTDSGFTNPYQYTGREADTPGLYYYRARYYSPMMGGFISEDPLRFGGGQLTFYGYAGADPLDFNDPRGTDPLIGATVGLIAGAIQGGLGAAIQGGGWKEIAASAAVGGAIGFGIGFIDPSLGVGTLAIVGGVSGGIGDVAGQLIASYGDKCKSINWGSTVGAVIGGAIGGGGGTVFGALGQAAGLSEGVSTAFGASLTSGPGIFLPAMGGAISDALSTPEASCGCTKK